jgi:hypothetical protein
MNARLHLTTLDSTGQHVERQLQLLKGGGAIFLDVVAQGDGDPYPGTIWILDYGMNQILVLQPAQNSTLMSRLDRLSSRGEQSACETIYSGRRWLFEMYVKLGRPFDSKIENQ